MNMWSKFIQNPAEMRLAASQWLLLYVIKEKDGGITIDEVYDRLVEKSTEIKKVNPSFFIMWSFGYSLSDVILAQEEFGFIRKKQGDVIQWEITERGGDLIKETTEYVSPIIGRNNSGDTKQF